MGFARETAGADDLPDRKGRAEELRPHGFETDAANHFEDGFPRCLAEALVEEAPGGTHVTRHVHRADSLRGVVAYPRGGALRDEHLDRLAVRHHPGYVGERSREFVEIDGTADVRLEN